MSDCCLTPSDQLFSCIMVRTSYVMMMMMMMMMMMIYDDDDEHS
jgi:hypothetical protein